MTVASEAIETRGAAVSTSLRDALFFALPVFPIAGFVLFLKLNVMWQLDGYLTIAHALGYPKASDLSIPQLASFLRSDILVFFVLAPIGLFGLSRLSGRRATITLSLALPVSVFVFSFMNLQSLHNTGRFLSLPMIGAAIEFVNDNPQYLGSYARPSALLKAFLVIAVVAGVTFCVCRLTKLPATARLSRAVQNAILGAMGLAIAFGSGLWLADIPVLAQHTNIGTMQLDALLQRGVEGPGDFAQFDDQEAIASYRYMAEMPQAPDRGPAWGSEAGSDVLIIVLETGAQRLVRRGGLAETMPTMARLADRGYTARRHHATFPYTTFALFSMFTSVYPWPTVQQHIEHPGSRLEGGLINRLNSAGYFTKFYSATPTERINARMYELVGFQEQRDLDSPAPPNPAVERRADELMAELGPEAVDPVAIRKAFTDDLVILEAMKAEIRQAKSSGRRFASVFLPQISHGPWLDLHGDGPDVVARGRVVLSYVDRWITDIVALLEDGGWLDDTVIVMVGDHGVRNKTEYPAFPAGMIDEFSFEVPMVIYAPNSPSVPAAIDHVTSHVDIAPTLLDLLGISYDRRLDQGAPIWDPNLEQRRTYFLAADYVGSDGYHQNGHYYMANRVLSTAYANDRLSFDNNNYLLPETPEYDDVMARTTLFSRLLERWASLIITQEPAGP